MQSRLADDRAHRVHAGAAILPDGGEEAEADGLLMGRFLMTPVPGAHPTLEQRLVAVALADQAGAALGNARRPR